MNRDQINRARGHFDYLEQMLKEAISYCQAAKKMAEGMDEAHMYWANEKVFTLITTIRKALLDFSLTGDGTPLSEADTEMDAASPRLDTKE